jgi:hypothetical protein
VVDLNKVFEGVRVVEVLREGPRMNGRGDSSEQQGLDLAVEVDGFYRETVAELDERIADSANQPGALGISDLGARSYYMWSCHFEYVA